MNDNFRRVKNDSGVVHEAANRLHQKLQFKKEDLDENGKLFFRLIPALFLVLEDALLYFIKEL